MFNFFDLNANNNLLSTLSESSNKKTPCATCSNIGGFNRGRYDQCEYTQKTQESVAPLDYRMSIYQYENDGACTMNNKYNSPQSLVDQESELRNITRLKSKCNNEQYNPACARSDKCTSTYDQSNPVVLVKNVCPVVYTNMREQESGLKAM